MRPAMKPMLNYVQEISERLRVEEMLNARELSDIRLKLAGEYAFINSQLIQIRMRKPDIWKKLRYDGETKSDTAAERKWQATEDGLGETICVMKLREIDKLMSAVKSRLDVLFGEAHNSF